MTYRINSEYKEFSLWLTLVNQKTRRMMSQRVAPLLTIADKEEVAVEDDCNMTAAGCG
jgi:hypothetical protein